MTTTDLLSRASGLDLRSFREEHVAERIRRAIAREEVADAEALARRVRGDASVRSRFRRSVALPVSGLFRDPAQFDFLEREVLPELISRGRRIAVWSAGCADGSELYSVAMLLERLGALERAPLLGSDLLEENLEAARRGEYRSGVVPRHLRVRARWETRDLTRDGAPPGRWRIVLCRNVLIYLDSDAREAAQRTLAAALASDGVLLLGRSERLRRPAELGLEPAGPHAYRRTA